MLLRTLSSTSCALILAASCSPAAMAQIGGMNMPATDSSKPLPSPAASASVTLAGQTITIKYNQPSLRGRHLGGPEIVPWDKVWRTGANPATTVITPISLHMGQLLVPAGTYTLYTLPRPNKWLLIVNKQTGQWGTVYNQDQDLGRTELKAHTLANSQEVMSISFDDIKRDSAELHIRWENTDQSIRITTP